MQTERPVKPAETMRELIGNFNHMQPIDERHKIFYVDFFKDKIEDLRIRLVDIEYLNPGTAFYITGQKGTGKSSALFQLPTDELKQQFEFVYITFYKDVDIADIDIVDVLMNIGQVLVQKDNKLVRKFDDNLKEMKDLYQGTKEIIKQKQTDKDFSFSAKLWIKFTANREFRKKVREYIRPNIDDFVNIVNDIVALYKDKLAKQGKKLILILDDLEKMIDIEQIRNLFIDSHQYLIKINVPKIISFPVILPTIDSRINTQSESERFTFTTSGVNYHGKAKRVDVERTRKLFYEVVKKRVAKSSLITDEAIELAIDFSGGNMRQFIKLIQNAGFEARLNRSETITKKQMEQAIAKERLELSYSIVGEKKDILKYVRKYKELPKTTNDKDTDNKNIYNEVINCILSNLIISYSNGDAWYDVNPLIWETIEK